MPTDAGLFADGVPGALRAAGACLAAAAQERHGPYSGASPERLAEVAAGIDPFPEEGAGRPLPAPAVLQAGPDGQPRLVRRRVTCCLNYTVAGQPCATCPLLPPAETRRRLLAPA